MLEAASTMGGQRNPLPGQEHFPSGVHKPSGNTGITGTEIWAFSKPTPPDPSCVCSIVHRAGFFLEEFGASSRKSCNANASQPAGNSYDPTEQS